MAVRGNIHGLTGVLPAKIYLVLARAFALRVDISILQGVARKVLVIVLRFLIAVFRAFVACFIQ